MKATLSLVMGHASIRIGVLIILFFGFAGAATGPYQAIIGIRDLGLDNATYSALMLVAALVTVSASVFAGIVADRIGDYRKPMFAIALFGVAGYGLVYLAASAPAFIAAKLVFLPVFGALNALAFAHVRADTKGLSMDETIAVNSILRATISLSWVLVPGIVGAVLAVSGRLLSAFLFSGLCAAMCFLFSAFALPKTAAPVARTGQARYGFLASLGEVCAGRVLWRVVGIALISSMLHLNDSVRSLIITGQAGGTVVGIVAALEIVFILFWSRVEQRLPQTVTLAAGAALYAAYLVLQGFATAPWHIYAQTLISGLGAAAIISIPITYLQELIADRPGLGSSLIAVNIFLAGGFGALVFALGTAVADYAAASILGGAFGLAGVLLLFLLDGPGRRR